MVWVLVELEVLESGAEAKGPEVELVLVLALEAWGEGKEVLELAAEREVLELGVEREVLELGAWKHTSLRYTSPPETCNKCLRSMCQDHHKDVPRHSMWPLGVRILPYHFHLLLHSTSSLLDSTSLRYRLFLHRFPLLCSSLLLCSRHLSSTCCHHRSTCYRSNSKSLSTDKNHPPCRNKPCPHERNQSEIHCHQHSIAPCRSPMRSSHHHSKYFCRNPPNKGCDQ